MESIGKSFLDYQISTSHNSYLPGSQICSCIKPKTSKSHISSLIEKEGVRMIELDIHEIGGRAMIAHGNDDVIVSRPISTENVFEGIAEFMETNPNCSPLWLDFEMRTEEPEIQDMLSDTLNAHLSRYLIPGTISLGYSGPLDYRGRIVVLAGNVSGESKFKNDVNVFKSQRDFQNISFPETEEDFESLSYWLETGAFIRCYPRNKLLSSNFDAQKMLNMGVHCVAMNFQTRDSYLKQYKKRFSDDVLVGYRPLSKKP